MSAIFEPIDIPGTHGSSAVQAQLAVDHERQEAIIRCDGIDSDAFRDFASQLLANLVTPASEGCAKALPYRLLIELCGTLLRAKLIDAPDGSKSLWFGDAANLRDERRRASASIALQTLAELGHPGVAEFDSEGCLHILVDVEAGSLPPALREKVLGSVLYEQTAFASRLHARNRDRTQWPGMLYLRDGHLCEFGDEDEWVQWLSHLPTRVANSTGTGS